MKKKSVITDEVMNENENAVANEAAVETEISEDATEMNEETKKVRKANPAFTKAHQMTKVFFKSLTVYVKSVMEKGDNEDAFSSVEMIINKATEQIQMLNSTASLARQFSTLNDAQKAMLKKMLNEENA